jgi:hypothetical protein
MHRDPRPAVAAQLDPAAQGRCIAVKVVCIQERSLIGHLELGTWRLHDIMFKRLDGDDPFGDIGAQYVGSGDDAAPSAHAAR